MNDTVALEITKKYFPNQKEGFKGWCHTFDDGEQLRYATWMLKAVIDSLDLQEITINKIIKTWEEEVKTIFNHIPKEETLWWRTLPVISIEDHLAEDKWTPTGKYEIKLYARFGFKDYDWTTKSKYKKEEGQEAKVLEV